MVTAQDKPGIQTYERSAVFLMLKAFYDVVGRENVERISVEYSLSSALFILARGNFTLDQALLTRVEARMRQCPSKSGPSTPTTPLSSSGRPD
jgi:uridine kinase